MIAIRHLLRNSIDKQETLVIFWSQNKKIKGDSPVIGGATTVLGPDGNIKINTLGNLLQFKNNNY